MLGLNRSFRSWTRCWDVRQFFVKSMVERPDEIAPRQKDWWVREGDRGNGNKQRWRSALCVKWCQEFGQKSSSNIWQEDRAAIGILRDWLEPHDSCFRGRCVAVLRTNWVAGPEKRMQRQIRRKMCKNLGQDVFGWWACSGTLLKG